MITFTEVGKQLTPQILIEFENRNNIRLPEQYKAFLLHTNGAQPDPSRITKTVIGEYIVVFWFYSIDNNYKEEDLAYRASRYMGKRMPGNILPIAEDQATNMICISVRGDDIGTIYYWEHEEETPEGEKPDYRNLYKIANSFNELLSKFANES